MDMRRTIGAANRCHAVAEQEPASMLVAASKLRCVQGCEFLCLQRLHFIQKCTFTKCARARIIVESI
jgi:hypothetical protein